MNRIFIGAMQLLLVYTTEIKISMRINILASIVFLIGLIYLGSCGCESYVATYTFNKAIIQVFDKFDYNEDSTETLETEWRPADNMILGETIKVGVNFIYTYSHDLELEECKPDYISFTDSVKNVDIIAVYPLEGVAAGSSVLELGGWTAAMKDSLLHYVNTPIYPADGAIYIALKAKPIEEKVQFKVVIDKARGEDFEVLTKELVWR